MKSIEMADGRKLRYELTRKKVKNINYRIKSDGIVYVSANSRVDEGHIIKILLDNADYIFSSIDHLREREQRSEQSTDEVKWLGRAYPVKILHNARNTAVLEDNELRVLTQDDDNAQRLINEWLSRSFSALCKELNTEVRRELTEQGLNPPDAVISIKDMKSRWGSCAYNKGRISINIRLAAYPRNTVLSVFWHEYAHFYHHDHSARFYAFLDKYFPEYHKWNDLLK
ncbi:MAG: M48 family metallopeptidase [Oscillospiraceae bacterium]